VGQRRHPAPAADDRELPLADLLGDDPARRPLNAGTRAVERTVADRDAVAPTDAGYRRLQVAQCFHALPGVRRRVWLERVVLAGDLACDAFHPQRVALRDDLAGP